MIYKIKNINLALTNRCNLKCLMCDIWKEKDKVEISKNIIKKIFESEYADNNLEIALTGGEPFLYNNLSEITTLILERDPSSLRTITTNGALTNNILNYLNDFHKKLSKMFSLNISLDGIEKHDYQRGTKSFNKIIQTINCVKDQFPLINLKVKFTITPTNYEEIISVFNYCRENNLDFRVKIVEHAKNYTNKLNPEIINFTKDIKQKIVQDLSLIYKQKIKFDTKDAEFILKTSKFLLNQLEPSYCKTPFQRIFIMPNEDVYSCAHYSKIGNLNKNILDNIWMSKKSKSIRKNIENNLCNKCVSYHGFQ